jgi:hypothetical protein
VTVPAFHHHPNRRAGAIRPFFVSPVESDGIPSSAEEKLTSERFPH